MDGCFVSLFRPGMQAKNGGDLNRGDPIVTLYVPDLHPSSRATRGARRSASSLDTW